MLFERSDEGDTPGLALLAGRVVRLRHHARARAGRLKVPHMGWNEVWQVAPARALAGHRGRQPLLLRAQLLLRARARRASPPGETRYAGAFTSAIARDNIFATQFHPEKSSVAGLALLSNFATWNP